MEATATSPNFNKFSIPLKWGLIIGLVNIILFTVLNMFLMDATVVLYISWFLLFVLNIVLLGMCAKAQRTAMGGYITFGQAMFAIVIATLIMTAIITIYSNIYIRYIDPSFEERMKEQALNMTYKFGGNDEIADKTAENMDKEFAEGKTAFGQIKSYVKSVVFYCLVGMISAAIVKKKKPEHLA
jgi:hypothetical protein